ncbi:MAG: signal recognition particle-docking protein FtsY, partial [Ilumatobacteraceae bacterium]|nr:signal recognition particle-docking protein FtsY [Ilumatobacteraceae bacterium]
MMIASQQPLLLVLLAVVLSFGIGTVVVSRRSARTHVSIPQNSVVGVVHEAQEVLDAVAETPSLKSSIGRARSLFYTTFTGIRSRSSIDDSTWQELEDTLIRADVGVHLAQSLLAPLREQVREKSITTPDVLIDALRVAMKQQLSSADRSLRIDTTALPSVWLFVGVNGVGKTTTIGKVGAAQTAQGRTVLMAAGDTFRAAAAEQLQTWAERAGAEFVRGSEGGDPASVIFDGIQSAAAR